MHIESLGYFYLVGKTKSISKVAADVYLSQSALSQQIQKLENNLGCELLIRSNRGVELTPDGEIVFKYAAHIIGTYDKMRHDLRDHRDHNSSIIKIEATYPVATYALPCTLYRMKKEFPGHKYELVSNFSDNVRQNIHNDICDLGFVIEKVDDDELIYFQAGTDRIILVADIKMKIAAEIGVQDLLQHPLILLTNRFEIRKIVEEKLKKMGHNSDDLNVVFDLDSIEAIKSSVARRHGLAFLPYIAIKKELYNKQFKPIKVIDFKSEYEIYLAHKKTADLNSSTKGFIQYFKKIGKKSFC